VGRRTREIGIRLALGEMPRSVSAGILRHATLLAFGGIAIGVMGAAAATRLVSAFLYGLSPQDPLTLAGVGIGIAVVAVLASWQPARRAAKLDPLAAIRAE
jgi:ABC-type antimicrobial peptide transport system permease subunit